MNKPTNADLPIWMRRLIVAVRSMAFDGDEPLAQDFPSPFSVQVCESPTRASVEDFCESRPPIVNEANFASSIPFDKISDRLKEDDFNASSNCTSARNGAEKPSENSATRPCCLKIPTIKFRPAKDSLAAIRFFVWHLPSGLPLRKRSGFSDASVTVSAGASGGTML